MQTIDIKKFKSLFPHYLGAEIGDDFFIADFDLTEEKHFVEFPCRVDGYVAFFCQKGDMEVDINLNTFKVGKNTLIINVPGNIFRVSMHNTGELRLFVVAISKDFFSSINVDFNKLFNESMLLLSNPCIVLEEKEVDLLNQYMTVADMLVGADLGNKKEIIGSLIASVTCLFSVIWSKHLSVVEMDAKRNSTRANVLFDQFLKLVTQYHMTERGVAFYADKLFLTPKYLSKLVKSVSGTSAPDWINSFIILEAKNMLKYSDLTISEIVYKLNFTSQSVFYKFFKCHTGMTPSEYRKM